MSSLNSVSFIGNLVADPVMRQVSNQTVVNFRIAINETYKEVERTTYLNVSAWNDVAEEAIDLKKGSQVYVSGRLDIKTWDREVTAPISGEVFIVKSENISIVAEEVIDTNALSDVNITSDNVPLSEVLDSIHN